MRKKLKRLMRYGKLYFTARVGKGHGQHAQYYVLLKRIMHNGRMVADHVWALKTKQLAAVKPGTTIEFEAEIGKYYKGHPIKADYHLVNITKVRRMKNEGLDYLQRVAQRILP